MKGHLKEDSVIFRKAGPMGFGPILSSALSELSYQFYALAVLGGGTVSAKCLLYFFL